MRIGQTICTHRLEDQTNYGAHANTQPASTHLSALPIQWRHWASLVIVEWVGAHTQKQMVLLFFFGLVNQKYTETNGFIGFIGFDSPQGQVVSSNQSFL